MVNKSCCFVIPILLGSLLCAGCFTAGFQESDLVGLWVADHQRGLDVLALHADGKYTSCCLRDSGQATYSGTWRIEFIVTGDRVVLEGFRFTYARETCSTSARTEWLSVNSILGRKRIVKNDDLGMVYSKVGDNPEVAIQFFDSLVASR